MEIEIFRSQIPFVHGKTKGSIQLIKKSRIGRKACWKKTKILSIKVAFIYIGYFYQKKKKKKNLLGIPIPIFRVLFTFFSFFFYGIFRVLLDNQILSKLALVPQLYRFKRHATYVLVLEKGMRI